MDIRMFYGRKTKTAVLAEKFRDELLAKRLPKDFPVMSERELAEHFAISPVTANRILKLLVEQDILYRKPQSGTFIKHEPKTVPSIAYAGPLPDPENMDPILHDASFRLLKHFSELGIEPVLISYYELRHPDIAWQKLRKVNSLLIHASFFDETTWKSLRDYSCGIAVFGNTYFDNQIPYSQVFPDFTAPLLEFNRFKRFDDYNKILIVRAGHLNSSTAAETVQCVLKRLKVPEKKIEEIRFDAAGSVNAYIRASRYFSKCRDLPDNTLIVSMSEYFSQAIREVFSDGGKMPDILSFDNMEDYENNSDSIPYFTSIDWQLGLMVCRALDLLHSQLDHPEEEQTILRIPAKLVIRESVKMNGSFETQHSRPNRKSFQVQNT